jgi:MFS family permease
LALAGAAPIFVIALGGMAFAGAGRGIEDVAATTLLQARADDEVRSRVFAAQEGAGHLAFTLAALSVGLLVELVGARGAFGVAAACGVGAVVVAWRLRTVEEPFG